MWHTKKTGISTRSFDMKRFGYANGGNGTELHWKNTIYALTQLQLAIQWEPNKKFRMCVIQGNVELIRSMESEFFVWR